jgi:hypothetical protein
VPWVEVFAVVLVSHAVGDFLLQTEWQATHKRGGLGQDPVRRRALLAHVYVRPVKHYEPAPGMLMLAVDQSFHLVVLFGLALAAGT